MAALGFETVNRVQALSRSPAVRSRKPRVNVTRRVRRNGPRGGFKHKEATIEPEFGVASGKRLRPFKPIAST